MGCPTILILILSNYRKKEYSVDAGSLNGNVEEDTNLMFHGDNIMNHFYQLFDGKSLSLFISGENEVCCIKRERESKNVRERSNNFL